MGKPRLNDLYKVNAVVILADLWLKQTYLLTLQGFVYLNIHWCKEFYLVS